MIDAICRKYSNFPALNFPLKTTGPANPHGHGHNYVVEVSVRGPLDRATGRAVDIAALDELVAREVVRPLDHKNLNREVAVFAALVPASETVKKQALPDGRGSESVSEPVE